jgi:tape measure domain-containing protein
MAEVELRVTADLDSATREVAGFRKEYAELVKQVEKPLRQVNVARDLERDLEATGKAAQSAKARLSELQRELINTDHPSTRLKESFREAAKELQRLERVEAVQANQLSRLRAELKGAGVDTTRMAAEQRRLSDEMSRALGAGRADAAARGIRERAAALQQQAIAQQRANMEAARESLGVNRYRAVQAEIHKATQEYELLRRSGKLSTQELAVAQQQLTQRIRESKQELKALSQERTSSGGVGAMISGAGARIGVAGGAAAGAAGVAYLAAQYAAAVDPIKKMDAQLKLATETQEEFNKAQAETFRIAQENQAPLADVVTLYSRLTPALRDVGRGQGDAVKIIEAVTKSLRISGATAQETAATIQQFSQALGSGILRGEEFNTLAESSPRLLKALADGLKVNVGALRDMAADGQLTADVIADALIGQLPKLTEEASKLPETFSGALTRMKNELQQFLKELDSFTGASGVVVGAVNLLATGFGDLADAIKRVNSGEFGDFFRADKQTVAGINNEISVLLSQIRDLQNARGRLNQGDPGDTVFFKFKFYSKTELDSEVKALEDHITRLKELRNGLASNEQQSHGYRAGLFAMQAAEMRALRARELKDLEENLDKQVAATKEKLAERVAAERKAASELSKAKQAQLDTQKRYKEALDAINAGAGGEADFSQVTALKVGARNALQAGDVTEAKRQAQAAVEILKQLAQAGESTYGFAGIINELQAIEQSADQQGIDEAQAKLEEAKKAAADTKAALEELKDIKVKATLSPEDEQALLAQLKKLAEQAGIILTIPVTPVMPKPGEVDSAGYAYVPNNPEPPKFATGGILRGPGTGTSDSILARLSNGEGIINARAVQHYGAGLVHQLNRLQLPRFAEGGIATTRLLPVIPPISPQLRAAASGESPLKDFGRAVLSTADGDYPVLMREDDFAIALRRQVDKRGVRRR